MIKRYGDFQDTVAKSSASTVVSVASLVVSANVINLGQIEATMPIFKNLALQFFLTRSRCHYVSSAGAAAGAHSRLPILHSSVEESFMRETSRRPSPIGKWNVFLLAAIVGSAEASQAALQLTGVNLAGGEFGATPIPANQGTFGTDYTYPTTAEVDYFVSKGMNSFRLPFRWERLQPTLNGALDTTELNRLNAVVNYATSHGASVILDPHNYARYYPDTSNAQSSSQGLIGSNAVPYSAFANFWSRLSATYKNNPHVIFDLMNEPNNMPTEQWVSASNAAISAIRTVGANNLVLVPGNAYTGAWSWGQSFYGTSNAQAMLDIRDSGNNFAFDVHQYMDDDKSGNSNTITNNDPTIGVQRISDFTQWLKTNNRRGFLGEFAVANSTIGSGASQVGDETIDDLLNNMQSNSDVWVGWNWWAAGPWWDEYRFTLEPTNLGQPNQADRPAMAALQPFLATPEPAGVASLGAMAFMAFRRRRTVRVPTVTRTRTVA